ncbi:three component ABC system middle component [Bacillus sp. FJAT-27245]|uniref:three component ABC system middle component n=1 Tax=Bacillus sp. FJAT-27245 TaxID=1684144 RepID=UPI0006A7914E|nr:three component ABC system middle component [Bacillus sp. FJAT-27245]
MSIKHIENLSLNPFFCSHILHHFLSGCNSKNAHISVMYLVLPFVFYQDTRTILVKANKKSDIYSVFFDKKENRVSLVGMQERIEFFWEYTNQSLIVGHNEEKFFVDKKITAINVVDYKQMKNIQIREYFRAAHYLGIILSKYDFKDVFIKLGVTIV